jgi:hypothetical protein
LVYLRTLFQLYTLGRTSSKEKMIYFRKKPARVGVQGRPKNEMRFRRLCICPCPWSVLENISLCNFNVRVFWGVASYDLYKSHQNSGETGSIFRVEANYGDSGFSEMAVFLPDYITSHPTRYSYWKADISWNYLIFEFRSIPPLWCSGQSSLFQIQRSRFDSRHYQNNSEEKYWPQNQTGRMGCNKISNYTGNRTSSIRLQKIHYTDWFIYTVH